MADSGKGHRGRLKERFLSGGAEARTEEALLELLLTYAIPQKDVQPLARQLLATFGDLHAVLAADPPSLCAVDGIGEHAAALLHVTAWIGQSYVLPPPAAARQSEPAQDMAPAADPVVVQHDTAPPVAAPEDVSDEKTQWRAPGGYTANNASKAGLVEETRLALLAYTRLRDLGAVRRELLDGGLPQRSRATRETIVRVIQDRLAAWNPPRWVCDDLSTAASTTQEYDLHLLLLLHTARQDRLLYDVAHEVVLPRWREGVVTITRADVQRFLDAAVQTHPEIDAWSSTTREKLAGNLLTILRDYGLLQGAQGAATKRIVEPVVSPWAAAHLCRLLRAEGVAERDLAHHLDWGLWLLTPLRAQTLLEQSRQGVGSG